MLHLSAAYYSAVQTLKNNSGQIRVKVSSKSLKNIYMLFASCWPPLCRDIKYSTVHHIGHLVLRWNRTIMDQVNVHSEGIYCIKIQYCRDLSVWTEFGCAQLNYHVNTVTVICNIGGAAVYCTGQKWSQICGFFFLFFLFQIRFYSFIHGCSIVCVHYCILKIFYYIMLR